jgi:L-alanine-DL-glutamate epimerase-like enolase superfamily enzyme
MRVFVHHVREAMHRRFGHAVTTRDFSEGVIVRVQDAGVEGLGECVPRSYVTGETPESVFAALSAPEVAKIAAEILGRDRMPTVDDVSELPARLGLAASCGLELALLDLIYRRAGRPLVTSRVGRHPLSRTLDTTQSPEKFFEVIPPGVATVVKVKVGLDRAADVERVRRIRELGGADLVLAVDVNMAWTLDEACVMADLLRPYDLAWYEEPLAQRAFEEDARLRERAGIRIMLDESLGSYADGLAAIGACDLFNIRLSKQGGFLASLRLVELARAHGLGVQLGTHPGSHAIIRAAEWSFAHAVEPLVAVEAVPTGVWFEHDIVHETLRVDRDRSLMVPLDGAGLGITLHGERLEAITVARAEL